MNSIDTVARELIEVRGASQRLLESGDIDSWLTKAAEEVRLTGRLQSLLLHQPAAVTDDPAVKELLASIDRTDLLDLDRAGMDLLWGSISPQEYATRLAMVEVLVAPFRLPLELEQTLREARERYCDRTRCGRAVAKSRNSRSGSQRHCSAHWAFAARGC